MLKKPVAWNYAKNQPVDTMRYSSSDQLLLCLLKILNSILFVDCETGDFLLKGINPSNRL